MMANEEVEQEFNFDSPLEKVSSLLKATTSPSPGASTTATTTTIPSPIPISGVFGYLSMIPTFAWVVLFGITFYLYNLWANQEAVLYHPVIPGLPYKTTESNPDPYKSPASPPWNLNFENVALQAADGVKLHAWMIKAPLDSTRAPTIVFFHANAGNIGFRLPLAKSFVDGVNCNVFMLEYRGYGNSEGIPSEDGIILDASAAMKWIEENANAGKLNAKRVFLFGQSLGGAVAIQTAVNHPHAIAGVILENTFTSISDLVDRLLPFVAPFKKYLLRLKWKSIEFIANIKAPIFFISGLKDEIVHPSLMLALKEKAIGSIKSTWFEVADGTHNDSFIKGGGPLLLAIKAFVL
jgi:abhydrolase domain-containing protein 13